MLVELIQQPAVVSALLVLADIVLSVFQYKKTGKVEKTAFSYSNLDDIRKKDIDNLIEYHEKVVGELKKIKKGG